MLFMHNNKYLPLTGLLTSLQWTLHNTACIVLHPAKYFDICSVKWLKRANQACRFADRLRELQYAYLGKWMKGNVWRINNVKRVCVKPEKTSWIFFKYFKHISWNISEQKMSWNFTSLTATEYFFYLFHLLLS